MILFELQESILKKIILIKIFYCCNDVSNATFYGKTKKMNLYVYLGLVILLISIIK